MSCAAALARARLHPNIALAPNLVLLGVTSMNLELIGQLVSVALIVGAGPIIIGALFARGGNL